MIQQTMPSQMRWTLIYSQLSIRVQRTDLNQKMSNYISNDLMTNSVKDG